MKSFLTFEEKCAKVRAFTQSLSCVNQIEPSDDAEMRYMKYAIEAQNYIGYDKVADYFFNISARLKADKIIHSIQWSDGVDENGKDIPIKLYADKELN